MIIIFRKVCGTTIGKGGTKFEVLETCTNTHKKTNSNRYMPLGKVWMPILRPRRCDVMPDAGPRDR